MAEIDKNPKQITRLRVEDQKKLESISSRVSFYPSDTEEGYDQIIFDTSLDFEGEVLCNDNLYTYGPYGIIFNTYDVDGEIYRSGITYNTEGEEFIFTANEADGTTYEARLSPNAAESQILTNTNVKTVFGNSLYGGGNINLYKHYLDITASTSDGKTDHFLGVIQSSNGMNTTGDGTKLKELLKTPTGTSLTYECFTQGSTGNSYQLRVTSTGILRFIVVVNNTPQMYNATAVEDRVETL